MIFKEGLQAVGEVSSEVKDNAVAFFEQHGISKPEALAVFTSFDLESAEGWPGNLAELAFSRNCHRAAAETVEVGEPRFVPYGS